MFLDTPTTDDPFVADTLALGVDRVRQGASADGPAVRQTDLGFGIDKRITDNFGFSLDETYTILDPQGGSNAYGFQNQDAALKYEVFKSDAREFIASIGVEHEFGGSGAARIGAEHVGSTTPAIFFGKGLNDLPDSLKYLRPLAVTGSLGYQIPDRGSINEGTADAEHFPRLIEAGIALEYSLRYLQGNVGYLGIPRGLSQLVGVVEFAYEAPAGKSFGATPTGVVAPGIAYLGNYFEVTVEAQIPVNRASGTNPAFVAEFHMPMGSFLPALGEPIF